jgi:hypothetical protein
MRYFRLGPLVAGLVWVSAIPVATAGEPKGDSVPFFNGKDLTGWEGLTPYWTVKDGALVGASPAEGLKFNTFLCSKQKYADFELKFQVRLAGDLAQANSGVQIRSELKERDHFVVWGPQCDMGQQYWASLYGEHFGGKKPGEGGMMKAAPADLVKKVLKPGEFNDYYIKSVGKHVTIKLNGEATVDADFDNLPAEGIIAFQIHSGPQMEVTFKDVVFKDLSKK